MTDQIFISFSKNDSDFAHKLADDLVVADFITWIDRSIGGRVATIFSNNA